MNTIKDCDFKDKKVICRVDFNLDIVDGKIIDDTRIKYTLPTIKYILDQGASQLFLIAHLGRPESANDAELSMAPIAQRLSELMDLPSPQKENNQYRISDKLSISENIRFDERETSKDEAKRMELAKDLAHGFDIYVNDAIAVCHRKHASVYEIAEILPHYAGLLLETEVTSLSDLLSNPEKPFLVILGGAKVDTKIGVIKNLLDKVDKFLIGGKIAVAFLAAKGQDIKKSQINDEEIKIAEETLKLGGDKIILPDDINYFEEKMYDIGPKSIEKYVEIVKSAKTVFWNGPLGYIEGDPEFLKGSNEVAKAAAVPGITSIISGGETVSVIQQLGLADDVTFISTGGGATLEFLAGIKLPGLEILEK